MRLIALEGAPDQVQAEAERLWHEQGATVLPMDILIRRAAMELHGLTDEEAYSPDMYLERLGTTTGELFQRLALAIGWPEVERGIAEILEVVRTAPDLVVITGDGSGDFVKRMGGRIIKV